MLNLSFLDFVLIFYLNLMDIIETTTRKINKKRKEKKVKEWKENEIEITIDSKSNVGSSLSSPYIMIFNKKKLAIVHKMEYLVKKLLIKVL